MNVLSEAVKNVNSAQVNDVAEEDRPMTEEVLSAVGEFDEAAIAAEVSEMLDPENCPQIVQMTPVHAAYIYTHLNSHNRKCNVKTVGEYARAMTRGEWLANHQGIAFYTESGHLADGQHRLAAVAISGASVPLLIYTGFEKAAIQTIDMGKARTAAEALAMDGVVEYAAKAAVIKQAKEYIHLVENGVRPKYTNVQVVSAARENDAPLTRCISKADYLLKTVTDAPMKRNDVILHLLLMSEYGHVPMDMAAEFLGSTLSGIAAYDGAPSLALGKVLIRAKHGAKTADRLTGTSRIATIQKAASLWLERKSVGRLNWSKGEGFPLAQVSTADDDAKTA